MTEYQKGLYETMGGAPTWRMSLPGSTQAGKVYSSKPEPRIERHTKPSKDPSPRNAPGVGWGILSELLGLPRNVSQRWQGCKQTKTNCSKQAVSFNPEV